MGIAQRDLRAASEDPGSFTISAVEEAIGITIAIRPKLDTKEHLECAAVSTNDDWTANGGSDKAFIVRRPDNDATNFISSTAQNQKQRYTIFDPLHVTDGDEITSIDVSARVKNAGAAACSFKVRVIVGGSSSESNNIKTSSSWSTFGGTFATQPNGSAWTLQALKDALIEIEDIDSADRMQASSLYVQVTYLPGAKMDWWTPPPNIQPSAPRREPISVQVVDVPVPPPAVQPELLIDHARAPDQSRILPFPRSPDPQLLAQPPPEDALEWVPVDRAMARSDRLVAAEFGLEPPHEESTLPELPSGIPPTHSVGISHQAPTCPDPVLLAEPAGIDTIEWLQAPAVPEARSVAHGIHGVTAPTDEPPDELGWLLELSVPQLGLGSPPNPAVGAPELLDEPIITDLSWLPEATSVDFVGRWRTVAHGETAPEVVRPALDWLPTWNVPGNVPGKFRGPDEISPPDGRPAGHDGSAVDWLGVQAPARRPAPSGHAGGETAPPALDVDDPSGWLIQAAAEAPDSARIWPASGEVAPPSVEALAAPGTLEWAPEPNRPSVPLRGVLAVGETAPPAVPSAPATGAELDWIAQGSLARLPAALREPGETSPPASEPVVPAALEWAPPLSGPLKSGALPVVAGETSPPAVPDAGIEWAPPPTAAAVSPAPRLPTSFLAEVRDPSAGEPGGSRTLEWHDQAAPRFHAPPGPQRPTSGETRPPDVPLPDISWVQVWPLPVPVPVVAVPAAIASIPPPSLHPEQPPEHTWWADLRSHEPKQPRHQQPPQMGAILVGPLEPVTIEIEIEFRVPLDVDVGDLSTALDLEETFRAPTDIDFTFEQ